LCPSSGASTKANAIRAPSRGTFTAKIANLEPTHPDLAVVLACHIPWRDAIRLLKPVKIVCHGGRISRLRDMEAGHCIVRGFIALAFSEADDPAITGNAVCDSANLAHFPVEGIATTLIDSHVAVSKVANTR
jgi:hypothetical protein